MSNYLIQGETLTGIADAIRAKSGSSDEIKVSDFATQIEEIEGGGEEEQPTAVDLSGYDEGVIVETFEDGTTRTSNLEFDSAGNVSKVTTDGVETSYSYEFDSEGNVTKISDSNGNATEIIGGDISIGTNIDTVEKTVSLNFSSGNMEVTPNDGEAFSKVSIPKPSTLVAENIAEGVDIAGVIGTLAGGKDVKFSYGVITGKGTTAVIEHNLGVIPDLLYFYTIYSFTPSTARLENVIGVSRSFKDTYNPNFCQRLSIKISSNVSIMNYAHAIDETGTSAVQNANSNSFEIMYKLNLNTNYNWIAIGGLT